LKRGGKEPPALPRPRRFKPLLLSDWARPEVPKLVRGFIRETDIVLIYGGWSSGKSFLTIDLGGCIACALPWRGMEVLQGLVGYVAGEAGASIQARARAWMLRNGQVGKDKQDPDFVIFPSAPDLLNGKEDIEELEAELDALVAERSPLRALIFDTLHACAPGSREDTGDVGRVMVNVRRLRERFHCAIFIVHHAGKDASRGARGSNSLEAAADVIMEVVEHAADIREPIVRKLRDGETPVLQAFDIDNVVFGQGTLDQVKVGVHRLTNKLPPINQDKVALAKKLQAEGLSLSAIAGKLSVSKSTAGRWCSS
jgi:hypothetical protein